MFPEEIDNEEAHVIFTQNIHNDEPAVRLSTVSTACWNAKFDSHEFCFKKKQTPQVMCSATGESGSVKRTKDPIPWLT